MSSPLYFQIKQRFQLGPASHMTHLNNLRSIINDGELRSYNLMCVHAYQNIANEDVQAGRAVKLVLPTNRPLHDYVPLYFGNKTPMVAANQDRNEEIIFLRFSLNLLALNGVVISDGNARANNTKFQIFSKLDDLSILDVQAIHNVKYAKDPELKRKKQAEILIPDRLPFSQVFDIACFSNSAREETLKILDEFDMKLSVLVSPHFYFRASEKK
jgi:hypothetical protein